MSEKKNIKRNNARVNKEEFLKFGRKGNTTLKLNFPNEPYLQELLRMGLL